MKFGLDSNVYSCLSFPRDIKNNFITRIEPGAFLGLTALKRLWVNIVPHMMPFTLQFINDLLNFFNWLLACAHRLFTLSGFSSITLQAYLKNSWNNWSCQACSYDLFLLFHFTLEKGMCVYMCCPWHGINCGIFPFWVV